ncbi:MAG: hydrophobin family protein [Cystobacter sp.]
MSLEMSRPSTRRLFPKLLGASIVAGGLALFSSNALAHAETGEKAAALVLALNAQMTNSCNSGPLLCCNSVRPVSDPNISQVLNLLGVSTAGMDPQSLAGMQCSPLSVIGGGGGACTAQPVCCMDNRFNGLIALGCTPINLNW